jgi:hypothetical protein
MERKPSAVICWAICRSLCPCSTLSKLCTVAATVLKKLNLGKSYPTLDAGSKESFRVTAEFERGGWKEVMRGVR